MFLKICSQAVSLSNINIRVQFRKFCIICILKYLFFFVISGSSDDMVRYVFHDIFIIIDTLCLYTFIYYSFSIGSFCL